MSYKDKPQLKLYKYENSAFILQAIIDDFQEISFEHNLYEAGQFTISINYNIPNALKFERGLFVQFGSNPYDFGEILTVQDSIGEDGKGSQIRTITGYDSRYLLKRRVIKNMNSNGLWSMTGKGEIVLRNLIKDQCGSGAEAKRQLPITNVIPASESALGNEFSVSENFTNLYEVCKTIATQSEIGWRIKFDGTLTLEVYQGQDLSQTVRFDTNFESLANGEFSDSSESYTNAIYIGGKGQNDDRDIYEGEDGEPSGLDRFESWDNQSSMTTESEYEAEALSMLTQYGQTLTMNGNGLAKCPYIFREQYDIGDTVTVAFSGKSAKAQILSITEHWTWGSYDISFAFGKPQNNLSDQLQLMLRKIQEASNKTNSTDSVRWYTIPTDSAMPKADVTYNTIGFQGTCAEGGSTFTLYLDTEKTGAKTYHVYFKQLAGGNLTLTTGRSGATDLVLNSGTYVAIIYVDENGNVTSQGATPTSTITSGNNQPATSSGVAGAISSEATARDTAISNALAIPTDAVLHYSFDEVPDYPDGTATLKYLNGNTYNVSFSANGTITTDPYVAGDNKIHKSNVNGNANYKSDITTSTARGVYRNVASYGGQIAIIEINAKTDNLSIRIEYRVNSSDSLRQLYLWGTNIPLGNNKFIIAIPQNYYSYNIVFYGKADSGDYTEWELLNFYIGDGSYSTPIIDNVNGQNNATNNGGIAVQGLRGKGAMLLNGRSIRNSNFNLSPNFAISVWVKPDNTTLNLNGLLVYKGNQIILGNGVNGVNKLLLSLFDINNNAIINQDAVSNLLPANVWTHIVIERNGTTCKVYINGEVIYTKSLANNTISNNSNELVIGGNTLERISILDDLLIFDRALSEQEVQALYLNKANTPKYYSWADWKLSQM